MAFFQKLKRIFNLSVTDEKSWNPSLWNLRGSQSLSGENVTEETALTYSAVFNAVALYSGTISTLPLHLFKKNGKNKILADEMPLFWVLYLKANPYMTSLALRETMMAHVLLWGNAYAEIVKDSIDRKSVV